MLMKIIINKHEEEGYVSGSKRPEEKLRRGRRLCAGIERDHCRSGKGEMCVIQGTSGSGKSTLLNCIGGLDTVDSGSIVVDGMEVAGLGSKALSDYRRNKLGFIFQFYNLVPNLTVKENIQVCQYLTKNPLDLEELLQVLGLTEHQNKFPAQLSGGQQQRCAIARALIKIPAFCCAMNPRERWIPKPPEIF